MSYKVFRVFPSVVEADKESEITVTSHDGPFRFYDDITYEVQFIPMDESDVPQDEALSLHGHNKFRNTYQVKPQNGRIKLSYVFSGEQEWRIHISTKEYKKYQPTIYEGYKAHWGGLISYPERGIDVKIYSLYPDLYERRVMHGDLTFTLSIRTEASLLSLLRHHTEKRAGTLLPSQTTTVTIHQPMLRKSCLL